MRRFERLLLVLPLVLVLGFAQGCSNDDESTPAGPSPAVTKVLDVQITESGSVRSDGTVFDAVEVGDTVPDMGIRGFLSFDITELPDGATIESATLDISDYEVLGNDPFQPPHPLGNFIVYSQNYGTLSSADYNGATYSTPYNSPNGGAALADIYALGGLTAARSLGYARYQVRLQFATETDGGGDADRVAFNTASAKLTVTYTE